MNDYIFLNREFQRRPTREQTSLSETVRIFEVSVVLFVIVPGAMMTTRGGVKLPGDELYSGNGRVSGT